ncbi:hypothetical protein U1Q18_023410 [Sarracenia purpurea var. burkii]
MDLKLMQRFLKKGIPCYGCKWRRLWWCRSGGATLVRRAGSGALWCGDCGLLGSGGEHKPGVGASGIGRKIIPRGLLATETILARILKMVIRFTRREIGDCESNGRRVLPKEGFIGVRRTLVGGRQMIRFAWDDSANLPPWKRIR